MHAYLPIRAHTPVAERLPVQLLEAILALQHVQDRVVLALVAPPPQRPLHTNYLLARELRELVPHLQPQEHATQWVRNACGA